MTDKAKPPQTENVILEYPYKVFGHLKVTQTQLIFNRMWPGSNTFSGVINISDLVDVKYLKNVQMFGVPGLELVYRLSNNQIQKVVIHFPSMSARLGLKLHSHITPEKIFETIISLKEQVK